VDGFLDWYWLGVLLGLGVSAGVVGREGRRPFLGVILLALTAIAVVIALAGLAWWGLAAFAGSGVVSGLALRRLSGAARLLGSLVTAGLSFVPALGYLLAVAAPLAGVRLGRRAGSRYAGLRVLAKD
jgi:uncharacterized membrane protein YhaH (DUF805 family)